MRNVAGFLLRNWPLKLGAVALATVLYGGVVLSESTRTWPGQVPIDIINPPRDAAVLTVLPPLTRIDYRASIDVANRLTNGSFRAFIDLSRVQPEVGGGPVSVEVQLVPVDDGVQIVDYGPKAVNVQVDPVITRVVRVTVKSGVIPGGLDVGPAQVEPRTVTLRGASTRLMSVQSATARVTVDASALNVDQEVDVVPLDETGTVLPGINVTPPRVRVRIEVARQISTATLPVAPQVSGEVARGYQLGPVRVEPLTVSVSGEAPAVEGLSSVLTAPIDISGRNGTFETEVDLVPPSEVTVNGPESVTVTLEIVPAAGSRSYETALTLAGARPDLAYALSVPSVLVNLSGNVPLLDALDAGDVQARVDLTGLEPGRHQVSVAAEAPVGLRVESMAPGSVVVEIAALPQEPSFAPVSTSPSTSP